MGRPKGAKNLPKTETVGEECPTCGSRWRHKFTDKREVVGSVRFRGESYGRTVIRRTKCKRCGQNYVVKKYFKT